MGLVSRIAGSLGYTPVTAVREAVDQVVRDYSLAWPTPMLWGMFGGAGSSTGVPVTPLSALQASTVYMCVKRLAEDIAGLRFIVERLVPDHGWTADLDHPFNNLLVRPNRWMTSFEFWRYMVMSLELRGNAIAVIKRGWDGSPEELIPLNWDRVSVLLSPQGLLFYNISHPQIGFGVTFHQDDVLHVRGLTVDGGYLGMTPIAVAQDVVGLAIAAQQHGAVLFRQGAQVAKVLRHPGKLSKEAAERISQSWSGAYGGVQNAHKTAVLEEGMEVPTSK
jgi:HK97 family phage portal protein